MFWSCSGSTLKSLIRQIGKPLQRFKKVAIKLIAKVWPDVGTRGKVMSSPTKSIRFSHLGRKHSTNVAV